VARFNVLNIFTPLDTEYRAIRAAQGAEGAAFVLAALNLFTGAAELIHPRVIPLALSQNPRVLAAWQAFAALLAFGVALWVRRSRSLLASALVLLWAVLEFIPEFTNAYGHATMLPMCVCAWLFAVQGLRGASALRQLA
jgi:hypothetical protein